MGAVARPGAHLPVVPVVLHVVVVVEVRGVIWIVGVDGAARRDVEPVPDLCGMR